MLYDLSMRCQKTIDARSYSHEHLEAMRKDAVKRVESGESPEFVAAGLGINRRTIYRWLSAYHYGGDQALQAKPIPGAPPKLGAAQMAKLAGIIRTKNPLQLNFEFALWTLAMIRELIRRQFAVSLSEVSVGRLMKRLGFTPQRPLYRAWQQNATLVEAWREQEFPAIAARAKREGAMIFFADESGVRSDYHAGTTWGEKGRTPIVKATGRRYRLNMLSAVNALGHFRFMVVETGVNGTVFCEFLRRLITGADRKIFLVVDGHPAHKSPLVRRFVAENSERIELFFLPPYSPQLNPDEIAWAHVKSRVAKATIISKIEMKAVLISAMRRLQKLPHLVASFFQTADCKYAAL
jgi:transposase